MDKFFSEQEMDLSRKEKRIYNEQKNQIEEIEKNRSLFENDYKNAYNTYKNDEYAKSVNIPMAEESLVLPLYAQNIKSYKFVSSDGNKKDEIRAIFNDHERDIKTEKYLLPVRIGADFVAQERSIINDMYRQPQALREYYATIEALDQMHTDEQIIGEERFKDYRNYASSRWWSGLCGEHFYKKNRKNLIRRATKKRKKDIMLFQNESAKLLSPIMDYYKGHRTGAQGVIDGRSLSNTSLADIYGIVNSSLKPALKKGEKEGRRASLSGTKFNANSLFKVKEIDKDSMNATELERARSGMENAGAEVTDKVNRVSAMAELFMEMRDMAGADESTLTSERIKDFANRYKEMCKLNPDTFSDKASVFSSFLSEKNIRITANDPKSGYVLVMACISQTLVNAVDKMDMAKVEIDPVQFGFLAAHADLMKVSASMVTANQDFREAYEQSEISITSDRVLNIKRRIENIKKEYPTLSKYLTVLNDQIGSQMRDMPYNSDNDDRDFMTLVRDLDLENKARETEKALDDFVEECCKEITMDNPSEKEGIKEFLRVKTGFSILEDEKYRDTKAALDEMGNVSEDDLHKAYSKKMAYLNSVRSVFKKAMDSQGYVGVVSQERMNRAKALRNAIYTQFASVGNEEILKELMRDPKLQDYIDNNDAESIDKRIEEFKKGYLLNFGLIEEAMEESNIPEVLKGYVRNKMVRELGVNVITGSFSYVSERVNTLKTNILGNQKETKKILNVANNITELFDALEKDEEKKLYISDEMKALVTEYIIRKVPQMADVLGHKELNDFKNEFENLERMVNVVSSLKDTFEKNISRYNPESGKYVVLMTKAQLFHANNEFMKLIMTTPALTGAMRDYFDPVTKNMANVDAYFHIAADSLNSEIANFKTADTKTQNATFMFTSKEDALSKDKKEAKNLLEKARSDSQNSLLNIKEHDLDSVINKIVEKSDTNPFDGIDKDLIKTSFERIIKEGKLNEEFAFMKDISKVEEIKNLSNMNVSDISEFVRKNFEGVANFVKDKEIDKNEFNKEIFEGMLDDILCGKIFPYSFYDTWDFKVEEKLGKHDAEIQRFVVFMNKEAEEPGNIKYNPVGASIAPDNLVKRKQKHAKAADLWKLIRKYDKLNKLGGTQNEIEGLMLNTLHTYTTIITTNPLFKKKGAGVMKDFVEGIFNFDDKDKIKAQEFLEERSKKANKEIDKKSEEEIVKLSNEVKSLDLEVKEIYEKVNNETLALGSKKARRDELSELIKKQEAEKALLEEKHKKNSDDILRFELEDAKMANDIFELTNQHQKEKNDVENYDSVFRNEENIPKNCMPTVLSIRKRLEKNRKKEAEYKKIKDEYDNATNIMSQPANCTQKDVDDFKKTLLENQESLDKEKQSVNINKKELDSLLKKKYVNSEKYMKMYQEYIKKGKDTNLLPLSEDIWKRNKEGLELMISESEDRINHLSEMTRANTLAYRSAFDEVETRAVAKETLDKLNQKYGSLEEFNKLYDESVKKSNDTKAELDDFMKDVEAFAEEQKNELMNSMVQKGDEIVNLEKERKNREDEKERLGIEVIELEKDRNLLDAEIANNKKMMENLMNEIDEVSKELSGDNNILFEKQERIRGLSKEIRDRENYNESKKRAYLDLTHEKAEEIVNKELSLGYLAGIETVEKLKGFFTEHFSELGYKDIASFEKDFKTYANEFLLCGNADLILGTGGPYESIFKDLKDSDYEKQIFTIGQSTVDSQSLIKKTASQLGTNAKEKDDLFLKMRSVVFRIKNSENLSDKEKAAIEEENMKTVGFHNVSEAYASISGYIQNEIQNKGDMVLYEKRRDILKENGYEKLIPIMEQDMNFWAKVLKGTDDAFELYIKTNIEPIYGGIARAINKNETEDSKDGIFTVVNTLFLINNKEDIISGKYKDMNERECGEIISQYVNKYMDYKKDKKAKSINDRIKSFIKKYNATESPMYLDLFNRLITSGVEGTDFLNDDKEFERVEKKYMGNIKENVKYLNNYLETARKQNVNYQMLLNTDKISNEKVAKKRVETREAKFMNLMGDRCLFDDPTVFKQSLENYVGDVVAEVLQIEGSITRTVDEASLDENQIAAISDRKIRRVRLMKSLGQKEEGKYKNELNGSSYYVNNGASPILVRNGGLAEKDINKKLAKIKKDFYLPEDADQVTVYVADILSECLLKDAPKVKKDEKDRYIGIIMNRGLKLYKEIEKKIKSNEKFADKEYSAKRIFTYITCHNIKDMISTDKVDLTKKVESSIESYEMRQNNIDTLKNLAKTNELADPDFAAEIQRTIDGLSMIMFVEDVKNKDDKFTEIFKYKNDYYRNVFALNRKVNERINELIDEGTAASVLKLSEARKLAVKGLREYFMADLYKGDKFTLPEIDYMLMDEPLMSVLAFGHYKNAVSNEDLKANDKVYGDATEAELQIFLKDRLNSGRIKKFDALSPLRKRALYIALMMPESFRNDNITAGASVISENRGDDKEEIKRYTNDIISTLRGEVKGSVVYTQIMETLRLKGKNIDKVAFDKAMDFVEQCDRVSNLRFTKKKWDRLNDPAQSVLLLESNSAFMFANDKGKHLNRMREDLKEIKDANDFKNKLAKQLKAQGETALAKRVADPSLDGGQLIVLLQNRTALDKCTLPGKEKDDLNPIMKRELKKKISSGGSGLEFVKSNSSIENCVVAMNTLYSYQIREDANLDLHNARETDIVSKALERKTAIDIELLKNALSLMDEIKEVKDTISYVGDFDLVYHDNIYASPVTDAEYDFENDFMRRGAKNVVVGKEGEIPKLKEQIEIENYKKELEDAFVEDRYMAMARDSEIKYRRVLSREEAQKLTQLNLNLTERKHHRRGKRK